MNVLRISILFFAVIFLRGTLLAEASINASFSIFFLLAYLFFKRKAKFDNSSFLYIVVLGGLLIISSAVSVFSNIENGLIIAKIMITFFLPLILFPFLLNDSNDLETVFKIISKINLIIIVSYIITVSMYLLFSTYNIIYVIDYEYMVPAYIYFPVTIFYGSPIDSSIVFFPRLLSFYRESGITQLMFFFCFIQIDDHYTKRKTLLKCLYLLGVLFTLSTIGIFTFFIMLLYIFMNRRSWTISKTLFFVLSILFVAILISSYYFPVVGIKAKIEGESVQSFLYRLNGIKTALKSLASEPFIGTGLLNNVFGSEGEASNFLIQIYQLGIPIWSTIFLVTFIYVIKTGKPKFKILLEILPCFVTFVFAQPLLLTPLFLLYFVHTFGRKKIT